MKPFKLLITLIVLASFYSCTGKKTADTNVLHADQHFTFPPGFPPDPGETGKKTIEGIDSDKDGLRDDLQRWIYARFPNDEPRRKALRQLAKAFQKDIQTTIDANNWKTIRETNDRANDCLSLFFPDAVNDLVEMEYVRAKVLNTEARTRQYLKNDAFFDGMVLELNIHEAPCDK